LLVELTPDEAARRFRTGAYPFLQGLAGALGWRASWCALGVRWNPTLRYLLAPQDLALLLAEAARRRPDVVIINERLQDAQWRRLAAAVPLRRLIYCRADGVEPGFSRFLRERLPEAVGPGPEQSPSLERILPDFSRRVLNRAPWAASPLIRIQVGAVCAYRRPLAGNPFFRGLDLPPGARGCSFCGVPRDEPCGLRDPLAFAVRMVAAAFRQPAPPGTDRRFEIIGSEIWPRLEEFFRALAARRLRGAEFWFSPRVDTLLATRRALRRCLPLMARRRFCLRLYSMGLENFSADENLRFNKGISAEQIHEAADFIAETSSRWPREFRFPLGDSSMILFTPWTTLKDLRVNARHLADFPLVSTVAMLAKRLQLFPGRPITRLAEHDGLLLRRARRPFYNSGAITKTGQREVAWRFRRPEVALLHKFASRLVGYCRRRPGDGPPDPRIATLMGETGPRPAEPLPLFASALAAMARRPRPATQAELMRRLAACHPTAL
jgi:hypothetical protein